MFYLNEDLKQKAEKLFSSDEEVQETYDELHQITESKFEEFDQTRRESQEKAHRILLD